VALISDVGWRYEAAMAADREMIWEAIRASNAAWTRGEPEKVAALFDENVVGIAPGMQGRAEGRDAIVASYVEYCRAAKTHAFEELDHSIDVFGDTAVATYKFSVRYEIDGQIQDEVGQEILAFARRDNQWLAVWRTQVPGVKDDPNAG
jgi:uncharacterized protein (TIGR02246 family)